MGVSFSGIGGIRRSRRFTVDFVFFVCVILWWVLKGRPSGFEGTSYAVPKRRWGDPSKPTSISLSTNEAARWGSPADLIVRFGNNAIARMGLAVALGGVGCI